jgi:hypothetical protein
MTMPEFFGPSVIIGACIGAVIGIIITRRRNRRLAPLIEAKLRSSADGLTLPQLQDALEMKGVYARGTIVLALGRLASQGRVATIKAPPGTPQLQKVNVIRYRMKD